METLIKELEALDILPRLKSWDSWFQTLVRLVKPLLYLLYRLRMQIGTFNSFCEVFLQVYGRNILSENYIVFFLQRKRMIPYKASLTKHVIHVFRILVFI